MAVTPRRLVTHRPPRRPARAGPATDCVRGDGLVCRGGVGSVNGTAHFFENDRVSAVPVSDLATDRQTQTDSARCRQLAFIRPD